MSQPSKPKTNTFSFVPKHEKPKLGKIKTKWNLAALYYTSEKDEQFAKDVAFTERQYRAFAKQWRSKNFTASAAQLAKALKAYETLAYNPRVSGPGRYLGLRLALNSQDAAAKKASALLQKRLRPVFEEVVFFKLAIAKIPASTQKKYLADPILKPYRYYLERVFIDAQHNLTEAEEKIISLKSGQSYGRWVDAVETIISNRTVVFKGAEIPLPAAIESLQSRPRKERHNLWRTIIDTMQEIGEFAEHEFNAIITDVRTEDDLRGYKKPYSATAISYEDTEQSIENLVSVMSDEGFKLSRRFYKLKAQYHGTDKILYTDKYEPIGKSWHIPFSQAVEIARDVFYGLKPEYGNIFDTMLTRGQIDVYPHKGKRGGAFMSEGIGHPTQVFLNQTDDLTSLRTLAHEMGHAIHAERGKVQPARYQGHSITTAETASTLFENLLFKALVEQADEKTKLSLLHDRLTQNTATMQRQIAFFNCELEIHNTINAQGAMTNAELAQCMYRHLRSYLGPAVTIDPTDGYSYVYVSHLRYGFYVYTYCFGLLMSNIMSDRYAQDAGYIENIDTFLQLGESATVKDIFGTIGIDIERKEVFSEALRGYAAEVNNFAALVKAK